MHPNTKSCWCAWLAVLCVAVLPTLHAAPSAPDQAPARFPVGTPPRLSGVYSSMPADSFIVFSDTMLPSNVAKLEAGQNYTDNVVWAPPPDDGGGKSLLGVGHGVTYSPALYFMDVQHIYDIRRPCSLIGPVHYHPHAAETNYVVGPGDGLYFLLISEDLKRVMFFRARAGAIVAAPKGWMHLPINTCNATASLTTFTSYDPGAVYVPNGPTAEYDVSKVELYDASKEEFTRIMGWVNAAVAQNKQPLPYVKMGKKEFDLPGCPEWCAQRVKPA